MEVLTEYKGVLHVPKKTDISDDCYCGDTQKIITGLCDTVSNDYCNRTGCNNCIINQIGD